MTGLIEWFKDFFSCNFLLIKRIKKMFILDCESISIKIFFELALEFIFEVRQCIDSLIDFMKDSFLNMIKRNDFGFYFV